MSSSDFGSSDILKETAAAVNAQVDKLVIGSQGSSCESLEKSSCSTSFHCVVTDYHQNIESEFGLNGRNVDVHLYRKQSDLFMNSLGGFASYSQIFNALPSLFNFIRAFEIGTLCFFES